MRRRDLSQAVSEHHGRLDTQARPERRQRAFKCVDRRLFPLRIVQFAHGVGTTEHHVEQRGTAVCAEYVLAPVEHRAHHRLAVVECRAHTRPLTGLSGVDERHLRGLAGWRAAIRIDDRSQPVAQRIRVLKHHTRAVVEVAPTDAGRPGHVRKQSTGRRAAAR